MTGSGLAPRAHIAPFTAMPKDALVARLKKEYAAEDYFTGVLGNRASAFKPRPKPIRSAASPAAKLPSAARSAPARRSGKAKATAR
jgi:hypothetical protein